MQSNNILKTLRKKETELLEENPDLKKLYAKDAMIKPLSIQEDTETKEILKKLKKEDKNGCVVLSKEKKYLGEITTKEIIQLFKEQVENEPLVEDLNIGYNRTFMYKTAKQILKKEKRFVSKETPINEVIKIITAAKSEYLPVLNEAKKVVGAITPSSLIKLLMNY